ncbi:unnamed protein product, partial [marine sediment metagenome]
MADGLAEHRQSSALVVGQPKALSSELLLENSILLSEIIDG